jgi:hypothetical protein
MYRLKYLYTFFLTLLALTASAEISVTAIFNPARIAMGDKAQYVVEIKETSDSHKPDVERINTLPISQSSGLELSNGRTSSSSQTSIINGSAEYSVTQQLIIDAKPPHVGKFTIPGFDLPYKGEIYRAPAATLEVVERPADAGPTTDELIFLKTNAPEQLYLGQTTPIELKLYISENVRITSLNSYDRSADGFTISELPESQESSEIFNGRRYHVLTWPITITPIQTGEQDLNFQFTLSANLPEQNSRRSQFGNRGFGSSIFDDFFGRSQNFTVYTEPTQINVLPLPTADQPASFSGAIGDFSLDVYTDRDNTQVGEPIMLSVEISGTGNFDRINGPTLTESNNWRSYAPESQFTPHDDNPRRGTKRFDYVMIPNQAGTIEIPSIHFAYFESNNKHYTELSAPPIPIKVSPSDKITTIAPTVTSQTQATTTAPLPKQKELSLEEALLTLDYRPTSSNRLAVTNLKGAPFWLINLTIALTLISIGLYLRHKKRLRKDSSYAELQAAKQELRALTKSARQAKQADHFYQQAQNALRLAVTCRTRQNHRTSNINELSTALQKQNIADSTLTQLRELFQNADAHRFAGAPTNNDLSTAKAQLEKILKAL